VADKPIAIVKGVAPAPGPRLSGGFAARISHHRPGPVADRIRGHRAGTSRQTHAVICDVSSENQVADAVANVRNYMARPMFSYITR